MFSALLLILFLLPGCTAWKVNQLASTLPAVGPEQTLLYLQSIVPPQRDRAQYLLDLGILKLYTGDLVGSRKDFEEAKGIMSSLQAVSITENFAAFTTNETLRSYTGSPTDKVLVHVMLALSYLMSGDLDGARVEMLQANITMKQEYDGESTSGQLASARFLAGLIYELQGEYDDAFISYHRAFLVMGDRNESIPMGLQDSLLYLAKRQGRNKEYKQFVDRFGREAPAIQSGEGEWIILYQDGVVSNKTETRISVFDGEVNTMVSVVLPHYYPSSYRAMPLSVRSGDIEKHTQVIENMEVRAREDLNKEKAKVLAAATVRAVAKYQMVQEAQSKGDLGGVIANIASVASEQADIRSWNMLPASIQVARIAAPLNKPLHISSRAQILPAMNEITKNTYAVVLASSLTQRLYSYPPNIVISTIGWQPSEIEPTEIESTEQAGQPQQTESMNLEKGEPHVSESQP